MGIIGSTFKIMGGVIKGASAATAWSSNMVYSGLQNAKTKKDIQALYRHVAEANLQSRALAVVPGLSRTQLLLTSGDADDDDVYDYDADAKNCGLNFIWGSSDEAYSVVVSGGANNDRVNALIPFVNKAQKANKPVIVVHAGNRLLEDMVKNYSRSYELISSKDSYYDVFRGLPVDDILSILYASMPKDNADPAAESLLRALVEVLIVTEAKISVKNLASFPLLSLKSKIDSLKNQGMISEAEYHDINHYCMAGFSKMDAVRLYLNRLSAQVTSVYGSPSSNLSNVKKMLNQKGLIAFDVGNYSNELLVELVLNHIMLIQSQGKDYAVLFDGIPIAKFDKIRDVLRGHFYALSSQDLVSSLFGGDKRGDELFSELTGNINTTVLFRHTSGISCQKWSDYLGKYRKIRIRNNISQTTGFINKNNTRDVSVDEVDEPRVKAETLGKLAGSTACIHSVDGILLAEVKEA